MSGTRSAAPKVRATEAALGDVSLILAVHGIRGGPGCAVDHAAALGARRLFAHVGYGCHKGEPDLVEVVRAAPTADVLVAPLLMAEGYTLRALSARLEDGLPPQQRPLVLPALGVHPRFASLIEREAEVGCADKGWPMRETALLIVGHGTRRDPNSGGTTRGHAVEIERRGRFAEVAVAFLDQEPSVPDALAALTAPRCVAVGLFLDRGEHGEEDIPELLAPAGGRAVYTGPVGVDPLIPDLILEQLHAMRARDGVA